MKKAVISMGLGLAGGMALATYVFTNPRTKKKANKMLNNAMDDASLALDDMKNTLKQK